MYFEISIHKNLSRREFIDNISKGYVLFFSVPSYFTAELFAIILLSIGGTDFNVQSCFVSFSQLLI